MMGFSVNVHSFVSIFAGEKIIELPPEVGHMVARVTDDDVGLFLMKEVPLVDCTQFL